MPTQFDLFIPHKALFSPQAVRTALANDQHPESVAAAVQRLQRLQAMLESDEQRDRMNEESFKAEYLSVVFSQLLGYRDLASAEVYNIRREVAGPDDLRPADAVLGFLGEVDEERVRAVVEMKAPGANLDARQSGRADRLSAVDQAFLYANQFDDVRWIIVSNFDEIRLYSKRRGKTAYESFATRKLSSGELRRFCFLLRRDNLLGNGTAPSRSELLAEETWREQAEVTKLFYSEYQDARTSLFEELRRQNTTVSGSAALSATQTILDRILFILFCAKRGLLPHDVISRLRRLADPTSFIYAPESLWQGLRALFNAVNVGSPPANIQGYNGGLFAPAPVDSLTLEDTARSGAFILTRILKWDDLDFESQLDVEVLGHVFENSITDIAKLEQELVEEPDAVRLQWRNRQGIFYTPEWVTRYIVTHAVDGFLEENPGVGQDLVVCDPACGSGAFLTELVPLIRRHLDRLAPVEAAKVRAAHAARESGLDLFADPALEEPLALYSVLRRSVFGVDKSLESVEITKLAFWLKTVVKGHPLPQLDANIKVGNSIVSDPQIASDAFDWSTSLPTVNGRAHVVVGNPPWGADTSEYRSGLAGYELAQGQFDVAFVFVERAMHLLADGGILGFVLPDSILVNEDQQAVRRFLVDNHSLLEVIKLGEGVFPGVFRSAVILLVRKGRPAPDHKFRGLVITKSDRREVTDVTSVVDLDVLMTQRGNTIDQSRIAATPGAELRIHISVEDEDLIDKIAQRAISWDALIERGRGIELNSDANVIQCPSCFRWDPPPRKERGTYRDKVCTHCGHTYRMEDALSHAVLVDDGTPESPGQAAYVDGTDIQRYGVSRTRRIDITRDGIAYKDPGLYAAPKILFRQTGVGTTATLDTSLAAYVPQSVYIFRFRDDLVGNDARYRLEYLLGVLNSRVMLYHFLRSTGQIEWQSFPRWTMGRVFEIPVRSINWESARERRLHDQIAAGVEQLLRAGGRPSSPEDLAVERLIMDLYEISPAERERIWYTLKTVRGVSAVTDLVPATVQL